VGVPTVDGERTVTVQAAVARVDAVQAAAKNRRFWCGEDRSPRVHQEGRGHGSGVKTAAEKTSLSGAAHSEKIILWPTGVSRIPSYADAGDPPCAAQYRRPGLNSWTHAPENDVGPFPGTSFWPRIRFSRTGRRGLGAHLASEMSAWTRAEPDAMRVVQLMRPRSAISTPLLSERGPIGVNLAVPDLRPPGVHGDRRGGGGGAQPPAGDRA
jgi:hypothetical protein